MRDSILWVLAFLGLFSLLKWSYNTLRRKKRVKPNTSLIIQVYNWEDNVERLVRFIASSCYFENSLFCPVDVVLIDMESTDHTINIIRKLARQYSFLKVIEGQYIKKKHNAYLDYAKSKSQGDVLIFVDATELSLNEIQMIIRFYFNDNGASTKVLERISS